MHVDDKIGQKKEDNWSYEDAREYVLKGKHDSIENLPNN